MLDQQQSCYDALVARGYHEKTKGKYTYVCLSDKQDPEARRTYMILYPSRGPYRQRPLHIKHFENEERAREIVHPADMDLYEDMKRAFVIHGKYKLEKKIWYTCEVDDWAEFRRQRWTPLTGQGKRFHK